MIYRIKVKQLQSDHGTKFRNHTLEIFCDEKGIAYNFSVVLTPKQNGVVEEETKFSLKLVKIWLLTLVFLSLSGLKLLTLHATCKID